MLVERRIVDVQSSRLVVDLPAEFVNHRVELIVLTLDEIEPSIAVDRMSEEEAKAWLAASRGAWGKRSVREVDAMIDARRNEDWGDD